MPRLAGDIPYRLLGGGQPTQACNRSNSFVANPQSKSHHNAAMFFNGSDSAVIPGDSDLNVTNAWTHMVWCAPASLSPSSKQTIYSMGTVNGGLTNSLDIAIETGGKLSVTMYNSGGTVFKKRRIAVEDTDTAGVDGFFFGANSWHQIVVTWDGATMTVYRNGLNMNSYMTNVTDIAGSQTNTLRSITAGNLHTPSLAQKFEGFIHSHAHWNLPLGQAEISTIYNAGSGTDVDLNLGHGDYVSNGNLETWYRYGDSPSSASHTNFAPTSIPDVDSTQTAEKVRRSAPEGSFYRKDAAGTVGETDKFQGVGNAHTVAAWVKPTSLPAEGVTREVWRVTNGISDFDQIALSLVTSGGVSFWEYEFSNAVGTFNVLTGTTPVVEDQWYHILGCKQDTFSARFFVNGLDDLPPVIGGIVTTTNVSRSTHFLYDGRGVNDQFDGDLHSVALWSVPVTEQGVKAIYSGGWKNLDIRVEHPCYVESPSLVHWWVLGDPSASLTHPAGDTQFPDRVPGGYTISTEQTGVGAEMRNRGIIETSLMGNCAIFDDTANLATSTALPLGLANSWTISAWIKPNDLSAGIQYPVFVGPPQAGLSADEITWQIDADDAQKPLILQVTGPAGTVLQRVRYNNLLAEGEWQHITMVWFDNFITMYYNGGFVAPVVDTTNAGTMLDSSRFVELGGSDEVLAASAGLAFTGKISHVGMWDSALNENEARTVASLGHGLDLRYNKNEYVSGANLQHYYKLGEDTFLKGRDFMNTMRGTNVRSMTVENGTVIVLGDAPGSVAGSSPTSFSLVFNGTDEYMTGGVAKDLGSVDAFSIMGWVKYDVTAGSTFDALFRATAAGNSITIQAKTPILAQVDGRITINMNLPGGFEFKDMSWYDALPDDTWVHFVFTYDGAVGGDLVTLYIDGVDQGVADAIGKDNAGNQDNTIVRLVEIGGTAAFGGTEWPGVNHQMSMWSNALTAGEVTTIYNGGSAGFDLLTDSGSYVSSAALLHWWQLGQNIANIGEDTGSHSTLIDLSGVNMDVSNRTMDSP